MAKSLTQQILDALNVLKGADPKDVASLVEDIDLAKAAASVKEVEDHWDANKLNAGASKEEIKIGPQAAASGDGGAKMVAEYSDPTKQAGTTLTAESLSTALGPLASSMKSMATAIGALIESQKAMTISIKGIVKAEDEDEKKDEEDETKKAADLLKKARKLLSVAVQSDEAGALKTAKAAAGKLLAKAKILAALGEDEKLQKSIADLITKADMEDEDEKKDEDDEAKKAAAKAGAKDDAAAPAENQTEWAEPEMKAMQVRIDEALKGIKTLTGSVQDVMGILSNQSKRAGGQPSLVKGEVKDDMLTRIEKSHTDGIIDDDEYTSARHVASFAKGLADGAISKEIFKSHLDRAPAAVKLLFADAA